MKEKKTPIRQWIRSQNDISDNLRKILLGTHDNYFVPFQFLEDITKKKFLGLPRVGKRSWAEFENLIKEKITDD